MKQLAVFSLAFAVFAVLQVVSPWYELITTWTPNHSEEAQYGWPFAVIKTTTTIYTLSGERVFRYELTPEGAVANLISCVYFSLQTVTFAMLVSRKRFAITITQLAGGGFVDLRTGAALPVSKQFRLLVQSGFAVRFTLVRGREWHRELGKRYRRLCDDWRACYGAF